MCERWRQWPIMEYSNGPERRPGSPPVIKWMSNIHPLNLLGYPASGRGEYTTVSVLEPVIRIERTGHEESDSPADPYQSFYRIVVTFALEVDIIGLNER